MERNQIRLTAFRWVPPFAQGLVRDLRVRWALEEAGLDYEEELIGQGEQRSQAHRQHQPFGQVPVYREDDLELFVSGAIVLHIAERSRELMPEQPHSQARVRQWVIAALNSVEPPLQNLAEVDLFYAKEEWAKLRRPVVLEAIHKRFSAVSNSLGEREYLEAGRFTAADLMMVSVLRIPRHTDLLAQYPNLDAYRLRCEARPAFQRALADQLAPFAENAPR